MKTKIVQHISAYLEGDSKTLNREAMDVALSRLEQSFTNQFSSVRGPRDPHNLKLYPSEAGKCERAVQMKALGIPGEPMLSDVQFKMAMGDLIELALMYIISVSPGVTVVENNVKREIEIGGKSWRGATDGILVEGAERSNVEVKSASKYGLIMAQKQGVNDDFGYLTQSEVYVRQGMKAGWLTKPETVFVYICRDTMKLWETTVVHDTDFELAAKADAKFERIMDAAARKKLLPRPYDLTPAGALGLQCAYCSHKHTCWTEPRQVVEFGPNHEPVYKKDPVERLSFRMEKNRPKWYLVSPRFV